MKRTIEIEYTPEELKEERKRLLEENQKLKKARKYREQVIAEQTEYIKQLLTDIRTIDEQHRKNTEAYLAIGDELRKTHQ